MSESYSILKPVTNAEVKIKTEGIFSAVLGGSKAKKQIITQENAQGEPATQEKKYTLDEAREILEPEFLKKANIAFESAKQEWIKVTEALVEEARQEAEGNVE